MKFDKLCGVILEGKKKDTKFSNLVVGNSAPIFTPDDILRDPSDPSKGSKLYLASKEEKVKGIEPGDPQSVRRQLRRVNWIAKKLIKKYNGKEVSIDKLTKTIAELLEGYQLNVLGWGKADKANTGYETRVIGNLLLPPTKRVPQGKSVFMSPGMDPSAGPESGSVKTATPRKSKAKRNVLDPMMDIEPEPVSAEDLQSRFEQMVQHIDAFFDDDLTDVIKAHAADGGSVRDILKDPAIKDVFDPQSVKEVVRGMVKSGVLGKDPLTGSLKMKPEGSSLGSQVFAARGDTADLPAPVLDPDAEISAEEIPSDLGVEDENEAAFDSSVIPDEAPASYGTDEPEEAEAEPLAHDKDDDEEEAEWWND